MEIILFQVLGVIAFLLGTIVIGIKIRKNTSKEVAMGLSRISHFLFWAGLVLPEAVGLIYPGLKEFDVILGFTSLPSELYLKIIGLFSLFAGIYLVGASSSALKKIGKGHAAFKLTQEVVSKKVYNTVRNPMSLGYYLLYFGVSILAESTYLLVGTFFVVFVHVFNLIYFEKHELLIRYGQSYQDYMLKVPFMIPSVVK